MSDEGGRGGGNAVIKRIGLVFMTDTILVTYEIDNYLPHFLSISLVSYPFVPFVLAVKTVQCSCLDCHSIHQIISYGF